MADGDVLELHDLNETGVSYEDRKVKLFVVSDSHFADCRFDGLRSERTLLGGGTEASTFVHCSFDRCRIIRADGNVRFIGCSFRDVVLKDWFCSSVEMIDCVFTGVLRDSYFNGSIDGDHAKLLGRARNEFRGNDFSGARLEGVSFRTGIDLSQQLLPAGPDYVLLPNAAAALAQVRRQVESWPEDAAHNADVVLWVLERSTDGGQRDVFFDAPLFYRRNKRELPGVMEVIDLLRQHAA